MQQALIRGHAVDQFPTDLYIPPDALRVFLDVFEGPLDFLSYLIRKQNIDILSIDVALIAQQYSDYIRLMQTLQFELAGDYLSMAAWLMELKSRFLLPRPQFDNEEETDPRAELIQRLLEYEQIRSAAESIDDMPRFERDIFSGHIHLQLQENQQPPPTVSTQDLVMALAAAMQRASLLEHHRIQTEPLSTRERMAHILEKVQSVVNDQYLSFTDLFTKKEGIAGIVVSLLALLELLRESCIVLVQNKPFGDIYVKSASDVN